MDVENFLKKSYILGGHCPDCGGFLFTEIVETNPLLIHQRCLKCGKIKDVTEDIVGNNNKVKYLYSPEQKDPIHIFWDKDKEHHFIEWYKEMIVNGDIK